MRRCSLDIEVASEVYIWGRKLTEKTDVGMPVPAVQPREQPWGDDGANAPGSFQWTLEPLPEPGRERPTNPNRDERAPLPNYASKAMPPFARERANAEVAN